MSADRLNEHFTDKTNDQTPSLTKKPTTTMTTVEDRVPAADVLPHSSAVVAPALSHSAKVCVNLVLSSMSLISCWTSCRKIAFTFSLCYDRVSTTTGNPGNLLEFVWSSWKFCIKCRWSTTLVSNHDKTGYLIDVKKLVAVATVLCCAYHVFVVYLGKLVDSMHYTAGRSNANMSWIFLQIPPGISWKSPGNLFR